jgi:hypothetical protein
VGAGCRLDVEVDVDVQEDGSGTITVVATADAELLAQAPGAVEDLRFDDALAAGWTVEGPAPTEAGGASVRLTKPFRTPEEATAILSELNGPGGPLHDLVVRQDREYALVTTRLEGTARLDGGMEAFADQGLIVTTGTVPFASSAGPDPGASIGLTVNLRAPGAVVETSGTADGGEVTWQPSLAAGASTDLRALVEARDRTAERAQTWERFTRSAIRIWLLIVAALAVVAVILFARSTRTGSRESRKHNP